MMKNLATKFLEGSSEEQASITVDIIRKNSGSGLGPIFALISFASKMATQGSARQRAEVANFLRTSALTVEAHQPTTDGNVVPILRGV
jgi:hypothetical protein